LNGFIQDLGAQVIPIDGKTLKGSYDRKGKQSALHLVSAWGSENRLFLGQVKVKDKSNEITAIPALLELLDISGCIITIDAMSTQTEIAHQIQAQGADYVLALKANHPTLYQQVQQWCGMHLRFPAGIEFQQGRRFKKAEASNFQSIEHSHRNKMS